MLTEERKKRILQILEQENIVKNSDLVEILQTSISTIRRDLQELEDENKLIRIHGGAQKIETVTNEFSLAEKADKNAIAKKEIAKFASTLINKGDTIFLDAGSTTYQMIPLLQHEEITVVTNSIFNAQYLSELKIATHILGGFIKHNTKAIIRSTALDQLSKLNFDIAFIGTNAIHSQLGLLTPDIEEANLKKIAMQQSQKKFILADHSKFEHISFAKFANLSDATIITDYVPQDCKQNFQKQTNIKETLL